MEVWGKSRGKYRLRGVLGESRERSEIRTYWRNGIQTSRTKREIRKMLIIKSRSRNDPWIRKTG